MSQMRGIRGATTVEGPGPEAVTDAVTELLDEVRRLNGVELEQIAAAIFTLTDDLRTASPAAVAREHGWRDIPLLQVLEHGGATRVRRCIRLLVLWNTARPQGEVRHPYLGDAAALRPDLPPGTEA